MSETIVVAAVGQYVNGDTIGTIGVSNRKYHDPALASDLDFGTFLPVLPSNGLSWAEDIRFQPQGGTTAIQVSDLVLDNVEGQFDDWASYSVASMTWTLKRGRPDQSWEEFETIFVAVGVGAPEFTGRQSMTIRLRDPFAAFSLPVSSTVFDENVQNERYANRLVPVVYGDVLQVNAPLIDPAFFRFYAAGNLAVVRQVSEGGRPTESYIEVDNGFQITQGAAGDTLPIRCSIAGPALPDTSLVDLLANYGDLASWGGSPAAPDGFVVESEPPDSSFTENTTEGGGDIVTALVAGTAFSDLNAGTVLDAFNNAYQSITGYDASGTENTDSTSWAGFIDANDAARVDLGMLAPFIVSPELRLTNLGGAIASDKTITGIEVDFRCDAVVTGGASPNKVEFNDVRLVFPNGSVGTDQANGETLTGTSSVYTFGSSSDLWGATLTPAVVNDPGFGVRARWRFTGGSGTGTTEVFEVVVTIHYNDGNKNVRVYTDTTTYPALAMETGSRYRLRIVYDDGTPSPLDSVSVKFAGVAAISDPIPRISKIPGYEQAISSSLNTEDSSAQTDGVLTGQGILEAEFIADGPVLGIEFFQADSSQSGDMHILRFELEEISIATNSLKGLIRQLATEAGYDPDTQVDNNALDSIEIATGTPRLGWYVRNQATRDQLATIFCHSCASAIWGGLDGTLKTAMFCLPGTNSWDSTEFLSLDGDVRNMGDSVSVTDDAQDLRDRVHAAQNVDPLAENETAGITETWPETERQKVLADWRITERVNFETIEAGNVWPILPTPVISSVSPSAGNIAGGDSVTINGSGFISDGLTVTFGGTSATSISVTSSGTITCDTPAGSEWTPSNLTTRLWLDAADAGTITESAGKVTAWADKSGNGYDFVEDSSSSNPDRVTDGVQFSSTSDTSSSLSDRLKNADAVDMLAGDCAIFAVIDSVTDTVAGAIIATEEDDREYIFLDVGTLNIRDGGTPVIISQSPAPDWSSSQGNILYAENRSSTDRDVRLNGGTAVNNTTSILDPAATRANWIGNRRLPNGTWGSTPLDGTIREIVVIPGPISTSDRLKVEGYLAHKWGLEAKLPAGHPYEVVAPSGSGAVDVVVTHDGGTDTLASGFEYTDNDIIASFDPVNWYDVSRESFTDAASISDWTDRGSDKVDLSQATGSKQPTYSAANDWLDFDEPSDQFLQTSGATDVAQPNTVVFVGELVTDIADQIYYDGENGTTADRQSFDAFGNDLNMWAGTLLGTSTGTGGRPQPMAVYILTYNSTSSELRQNDTVIVSGNAGTQSGKGFTLGGRYNDAAGRHSGLHMHELAKISGTLTEGEKDSIVAALKNKWGIS